MLTTDQASTSLQWFPKCHNKNIRLTRPTTTTTTTTAAAAAAAAADDDDDDDDGTHAMALSMEESSPVSIQTQSLALHALRAFFFHATNASASQ